jgi:putative phosphoribosyl transferase
VETLSRYGQRQISGFENRREAGRLLARELEDAGTLEASVGRIVVIGLARGGVEVAAEVAAVLHAPLDALAVRKVGHPWHPEYGIGAVAPGGIEYVRAHDGLTEEEVTQAVRVAATKAETLDANLHACRAPVDVDGATCVLVDDGLATGGTMVAAVRWARARRACRVVVAVPVGADATVRSLRAEEDVDSVVCLVTPVDLGAVGLWYDDFHQVSDDGVIALLAGARDREVVCRSAEIPIGDIRLAADLAIPAKPIGWVVFAHGSGSGRRSARNVAVATELNQSGIATLLFDLLTQEEELDRRNVFDVELLDRRLVEATRWLAADPDADRLPIAYFGASTGAAAALLAAAELGDGISAVVSRGGRPDLAWDGLSEVRAPTLLIVGGADRVVLDLNQAAAAQLTCPNELVIVPGATHLFEEPGALEQVAELATTWFTTQFSPARHSMPAASEQGVPMATRTQISLGMSEQELRNVLTEELTISFRTEGNTATIHGIAHSIARVIELDHLRIAEQLEKAGVKLDAS